MHSAGTSHQIRKVIRGWSGLYDLEEFIAAYHLLPIAAREIFAEFGPEKAVLDQKMRELMAAGSPTSEH